mgnify:CR=1 FL=1
MDTDGNVLINTNQQSSDSGDITVRNFRPEDYEDNCYSSGTFYGTLKTTQLSTVVPIKDTDLVTGYLVIHYPIEKPLRKPQQYRRGYDPDLYCDLCTVFQFSSDLFLQGPQTSERNS